MAAVNAFVSRLIDGLLSPFAHQPPVVGLAAVSLLLAVAVLAVVRATSNQARIISVKRALHACVYQIRLFNDDIGAMLRALGELVRHNLTYLGLSLVPVFWMAIPVAVLLAQFHSHYGYGGLNVGQRAVVKVRLRNPPADAGAWPTLSVPAGLRIETPAVWIPSLREAAWRVAAEQPGSYVMTITAGGEAFTKSVEVSGAIVRRSPVRGGPGWLRQLTNPAERPLRDGAEVESIAVSYAERGVNLFGWDVHWIVVLFVLSTIFALALRRTFRVVL